MSAISRRCVAEILENVAALGQARRTEDCYLGRFDMSCPLCLVTGSENTWSARRNLYQRM